MKAINLKQKLSLFNDQWSPRIIGELNGQYVKLAKIQGDMVWHSHANEDEMFLILKGSMTLKFRDGEVSLNEGECYIVPAGKEHQPIAKEECHVMLFEPKSTAHTGDIQTEKTVKVEDQPWI